MKLSKTGDNRIEILVWLQSTQPEVTYSTARAFYVHYLNQYTFAPCDSDFAKSRSKFKVP